jgi:hypothetical protein
MKKVGLGLFRRRRVPRSALRVALFAPLAMTLMGCYPKAGPPPAALSANSLTWASARWPGETASSLSAGRDLFLAHCNVCHSYPELSAIPDDSWPSVLEKMGNKSHLNAQEKEAVLHFVLASRSDQAAR